MATITRENLGAYHAKITVKLEKYDYLPAYEKSLKEYAKTANVPGFRKGAIPASMVKKMAGQNLFNQEIVAAAGRQLENYLKKERVVIFGQPMPMNTGTGLPSMTNPSEVDISFEIGVKPDFMIPALQQPARLTAYKVPVTDAMLEDELERIKRRFGNIVPKDALTDREDVVTGNFIPCDAHAAATGPEVEETTIVLGALPVKLQELLMGKGAGDVILFDPKAICTPEELHPFVHEGLKVANDDDLNEYYLFRIAKTGMLEAMEMGFELYEKVFPNTFVTGETDFREKVRTEVQREYDRMARERFHSEIYELLVHTTPITLPVTFLKRWLKEGGEQPKTELEVEHGFSAFEHQLRWQLITEFIMAETKISVSRSEVVTDIRTRILAYYGMDADEDAPWLGPYMEKVTKDNSMMDETYRRILTEKIFGWLENQFNTELKEIDEAAFFKLPHPHTAYHHHH